MYYIDNYIPKDIIEKYDKEEINFTHRIWDYKDDEGHSIELFTRDLMEYLSVICNREIDSDVDKLVLISVPSSKVKRFKKSSMRKSIDIIEETYNSGELKSEFNCDKEIINYKDLLKRVKDVPTAHLGEGRASCEEHIDSIKCMKDNLSNENIAYIVLDDVTTTGDSMRACNEHLLEAGVKDANIYNIALGATVRDDNE